MVTFELLSQQITSKRVKYQAIQLGMSGWIYLGLVIGERGDREGHYYL